MSTSSKKDTGLAALSLREFCQQLAAKTPTPSGGSLAASLGALGASGVSMTLRHATGEGLTWQEGRASELDAIAERLCDLVERDAGIYDKVVAAKELPEGEERSKALDKAYRAALDTPTEMMEACLGALRLALKGASAGVPDHLACDCFAGTQALWAGLEDAFLMVRENAGLIEGDVDTRLLLENANAMRIEAAKLLVQVRGITERRPE